MAKKIQGGGQPKTISGITVEIFTVPEKPSPIIITKVEKEIGRLPRNLGIEHVNPDTTVKDWLITLSKPLRYFFYSAAYQIIADNPNEKDKLLEILKKIAVAADNDKRVKIAIAHSLRPGKELLPLRAKLKTKTILRAMVENLKKPEQSEQKAKLQALLVWESGLSNEDQENLTLFFAPLDTKNAEMHLQILALEEDNNKPQYLKE